MGLFEKRELKTLDLPPSFTTLCGSCKLHLSCKSPKMPYSGLGRKGILVIAEAPGKEEDKLGKSLAGNSGRELEARLRRHGVDLKRDCWLDYSLACHPGGKIEDYRAIDHCRPHVLKTIYDLKPKVIILLGGAACDSLLGWLWKDAVGGVKRWAGYRIPSRKLNAWVCPTFHPSYLLQSDNDPILERQFDSHLKAACSLKDPYKSAPEDFTKFVIVEKDVHRAAKLVREAGGSNVVAFDYETTTLKPWGPHAEIFSCSVAWRAKDGVDYAASFPWHGPVIPAMRDLLTNPAVTKDAWNIKFEHGWTMKHLGVRVAGWRRDGMLAAHGLENGGKQRAITGLKFQAFVKLGVDPWNEDMELVLKSEGGNTPNRIKQTIQGVRINGKTITLDDVLMYGGLDSLYELKVDRDFTGKIEGE